jgi:long-chain acyl-CoA synthetase
MRKAWLESYPPGVPAEVDVRRHSSIVEMFEQSCARFHGGVAFDSMGVEMTYGLLERLSRDFAAFLQAEAGVGRGERVAIMLPNLLQYPVTLFGALRAGGVVVNVNPLYTAAELGRQLSDSGATVVVVLENFAHTLQRALAGSRVRCVVTTALADLFPVHRRWLTNFIVRHVKRMVPSWSIPGAVGLREALERGSTREWAGDPPSPYDTAFLQYTGGTTGSPKGAILTHANMVANVEQTAAWVGIRMKEGAETVVTALPLYHIFALTANLLVFVKLGGRNVLVADPRDLSGFSRVLARTRFSAITGVNTLYGALLENPGFDAVLAANVGALKLAVAGGMAVTRAVAERWQAATGVPIIEGYGLTEAAPIVCANPMNLDRFTGAIGLPLPSTEVAILDERGTELSPGEVGEICVRGPQVMRGYWNAPEETAAAFTAEGWLRTGDMGRMDERGWFWFVERRKDVIVVSGFKAWPTEIEDVIMLHPGVRDVGVAGVPDERHGEAVAAYIVRRDPGLTADSVLEHCRTRLAGYKLPRVIEFRGELPKSPIGKTVRRRLRGAATTRHELRNP